MSLSLYITLEKIIIFIIGILLGFLIRYVLAYFQATSLESQLKQKIDDLKKKEKEIILEAEKKSLDILENTRKERENILKDLRIREERIINRENSLDFKEKELIEEKEFLKKKIFELEIKEQSLKETQEYYERQLEKIAELSKEEALNLLFEKIEKDNEQTLIQRISKLLNYQKEEIENKANEIIINALPRYSRSVANEINLSIVSLPSEEMKGRIIGKEGRNIRYFEKLSGVQIIIDETPEIVTISSFDPIRREIAKIALEKLIQDGRIHPSSIEESLILAKEKIEEEIKNAGKIACLELGILDLPEEIIYLMGKLKFRYSYGQNVLQHSIEVGFFSRMIADELKLDSEIAKRAGFLHDIGKSVTHEIEGSHLEIGIKILEKYNIDEKIILAMRSHHETYPFAIPEAYVILAADAISSKRLGARSETLEAYLQRLENLEKIALSFEGVDKAYSISGGREVWVFVKPSEITDLQMLKLAKNIAKKIEENIRYPGEIKVVVIRENRAIEYAR
ncbi:MAG: ribonuclease Y [Candidatus Parcubacteria bacterium]|nr:MAG: ribonuclease Y [Candidatus Parcubacteria bacterium]